MDPQTGSPVEEKAVNHRRTTYRRFREVWESPRQAEAYRDDRFSRSRRWRWTDRREKEIVAAHLSGFSPGSLVLDIPCGAGRLAPSFRGKGVVHIGADVSQSMVRVAQRTHRLSQLVVADALSLPFREKAFDGVVAVRLLHRIQEEEIRVRMLREMARICKGPLLVTYYARWNLRGIQRWLRGKAPGLSLRRIRNDAEEAGLEILRSHPLRRFSQQQWFFTMARKGEGEVHV
jgi:SAM-dependent methyltransferase